tara:strand:- start:94 stop:687 length:594 start_codon:yes stop_codon:yes gene_type:complete
MIFDYLVIMDLWDATLTSWVDKKDIVKYQSHLKVYLNNLNLFSFKNIIISNGSLGPDIIEKAEPMIYEWAQKQGVPVYETEKYYENFVGLEPSSDSSFLVSGQAWQICLHNREFGFIKLLHRGHDVYTSPFLCMLSTLRTNNFITEDEFNLDKYIKWRNYKKTNLDPLIFKAERFRYKGETSAEHIEHIEDCIGIEK